MLRKPILALSANTKVRDILTKAPVTRAVVARFIPGDDTVKAVKTVADVRAKGMQVSLDFLGEGVSTLADAKATVAAYVELLDQLQAATLIAGAEVSVKLSAVGQSLPGGDIIALEHARQIVTSAYSRGARVTFDMEDHTTVDSTLQTLFAIRQDFPDVGVAIQAMLHRTADDLEKLTGRGSRVRLVKGAYNEPEQVAYQGAENVDLAYVRALKILMAGDGHPMVGSHDPRLIAIAGQLARESNRTPDSYEFQMLFGIRTTEQERLAAEGNTVRIYLPYGSDWYGYFTRRLAERPANLLFFVRSMLTKS
ncbi:proline dehydrogenase [Nakamurella antarctica]|uniref:proline dehydrogenase n=1 Tax=Nakamurella antarctica TaxID=1902245 RepID=A0A3G9A0L1_9ACTN|nr:proline dehydrogenase [Nakamurella antarctica]